MGVSIEVYRSTIGSFNNSVKYCKTFVFPKHNLFNENNHNFSYKLHQWSQTLMRQKTNRHILKLRLILNSAIASTILLHMLLILANDIHVNPGPRGKYI